MREMGFVSGVGCGYAVKKRMAPVCGYSGGWRSVAKNVALGLVAGGVMSVHGLFGMEAKAELQEKPSHFAAVNSDDGEDVKFRVVWEGYRSIDSQYGTVILFHNSSEQAVDVNWINYSGREVNYAVINPGASVLQPTFASHPWSVRDHTSQSNLALTIAQEGASVVTIEEDMTATDLLQEDAHDPLLSFVVENY